MFVVLSVPSSAPAGLPRTEVTVVGSIYGGGVTFLISLRRKRIHPRH